LGGIAVLRTAMLLVEYAKVLAAELIEAAPEDIVVVGDGRLDVAWVPSKTLDRSELARAATERGELVQHDTERSGATFPVGAHVAVIEIDTETLGVTPRQ
jgi:carbon-monoxide dehydrogenase large subunit